MTCLSIEKTMTGKTITGMTARSRRLVALAAALLATLTLSARDASAAPALRKQAEQRGDFILIGNTLGWDCGPGVPAPVIGTVPAAAMCGAAGNLADTSPDVLWRSDEPVGGATASFAYGNAQTRSTATLNLPAGAKVTYARVYWGSLIAGNAADSTVTLDRPGAGTFTQIVNADSSFTVPQAPLARVYYNSTADITALVTAQGSGAYRLGGVDSLAVQDLNEFTYFISWSMVVFYQLDSEPQRNLALFDGLDRVNGQTPLVTVTLRGFLVPSGTGFDGKLGVIAYEGDDQAEGDYLTFNGTLVFNALNPATDFFNGTRSTFNAMGAVPVSVVGDLPQLTGNPRSHSGIDLDIVNVKPLLKSGDTMATITATSSGDNYFLGAFITSIASLKPEFSNSAKTVTDIDHPAGPVRPGDLIEYTIAVKNDGNDIAQNTVLTDVLPPEITYQPGTLRVSTGANIGNKTDVVDADQGEYTAATRTLKVRLGTGANGVMGGTLQIGEATTVVFRARINVGASGTIQNQATINASGASGNPATNYNTDGNGGGPGNPPTPLPIDECGVDTDCTNPAKPYCVTAKDPNICAECKTGANCPVAKPVCSASTNTCVPQCGSDADCSAPTPACMANGRCGECTTNVHCPMAKPVCDVPQNKCIECVDNSTCPMDRPRCDAPMKVCVGCLSNADCMGAKPVCDMTTRACRACGNDGECTGTGGGTTPACMTTGACGECSAANKTKCTGTPKPACDVPAGKCVECTDNMTCPMDRPLCDTAMKVCVGCLSSMDCMGAKPVCDMTTRACRACGNDTECPMSAPACQPTGACGECSATNMSRCMGATPVCNVAAGKCVECVMNGNCPPVRPVCNLMTNMCRPCMADAECPMNLPVCLASGLCGECSAANKTRCMGATPLCDVVAAKCVACLTNADCPAATLPFCSPVTSTCAPCMSDGPPSCIDPPRPACQTAGNLVGACTECSAANATRCAASKPQCLVNLGLCGCTDTDGDSECGGSTSGIVCNGPAGSCAPGCSTAAGRNNCPAGQVCSDQTGKVGTCNTPLGCQSNADCIAPRPVCDTAANPRVCVQCLMDGQCTMPLICDATGSKSCVECTVARSMNCQAAQAGSRCLPNNSCGCTTDTDCGASASGRVCDTTVGKCTVGCRGIGGNGCPAAQMCTSMTMAIGRCVTASDAGVDAPREAGVEVGPDVPRDVPMGPLDGGLDVPMDRPADSTGGEAGADAVRPDLAASDAFGDRMATDASTDAVVTSGSDAGANVNGYLGGSGCGCRLSGAAGSDSGSGAGLIAPLALAALAFVRRQRRRR